MPITPEEVFFAYTLKPKDQAVYLNYIQQIQQTEASTPRVPVRTADTLSSTQYATFIDLLSEGEIEGFPSAAGLTKGTVDYNNAALKDIYLNNVSVLNSNANIASIQETDYNFKNVKVDFRYGTQSQAYFPGYGEISTPVQVNQKVDFLTARVQTITGPADGVIVTISVPRLEEFTTQGDILGSSFGFKIQIQYPSASYVDLISDTITGRTADPYQRDYRINFDASLGFPINIRISRTTADSTNPSTIINEFYFAFLQKITYQKLRYPNSALATIRFDAENFSSLPSRSYKIRGVKVKVPTGVTVDQTNGRIIYPSPYVFNGTFAATKVWTSDPAWILYDLLTNTRYGLGAHITASQLDSYSFYTASKYASALVDDGFGGQEPRFSCNALIQNQDSAYQLISDLCSVMRVMPYWSTGSLVISQDAPADASYLFTLANVTEEGFSYAGSSLVNRHTAAIVSYLDLTTQSINYEVVEDTAGINKYGWEPAQIQAFACTSRGQAARMGRWLIFTETNETDVVSFTTSVAEGVIVRPGQIIKIADPLKAIYRRAGRIKSATTSTVTVDDDDDTDLTSANSATLSVVMPSGSIETKSIASISGDVITLASNLSVAPNVNSIWMLQNTTIEATTWRVLSVSEVDAVSYTVTALMHNSGKYANVESGTPLSKSNTSAISFTPQSPVGLQASEVIFESLNRATVKVVLTWIPVVGVNEYLVQYRINNGNWNTAEAFGPNYEIFDSSDGLYEIKLFSLNPLKVPSDPSILNFTAVGKTAPPGDVQNLTLEAISDNTARLRWDQSVDVDVKVGGQIYIRHSNDNSGNASWFDSVDLIEAKSGSSTEAIVPLIEGEIFVKFVDDGGRKSVNETSVIVDLPDNIGNIIIKEQREDLETPPFQGTFTNTFYSDEYSAVVLSGINLFDPEPSVDLMPTFDVINGTVQSSGTYQLPTILDLGNTYAINLRRHLKTKGYYPLDSIDTRLTLVDLWSDWDALNADKSDAQMLFRSTNDNPNASPTWTNYQVFRAGIFRGRAFQFQLKLSTDSTDQSIQVLEAGYDAVFIATTQQSNGTITSGATAYTVTFDNRFFTGPPVYTSDAYLPSIGITAQNMASGDFFTVTAISGTGFTVTFRNSSNTIVSRNFNWIANGFGKLG